MCEVNYSITKKKNTNSKYTYGNNEDSEQIFIFEIILKDIHKKTNIIRKIKKGCNGVIIDSDDEITYNNIQKIQMNILDSTNINNEISARVIIDHSASYTIHMSDELYLEFNKNNNGYLECKYNI